MIRQIEEGDTKGGIIIPKDKFKEFVEFQKWRVKENQGDRMLAQRDEYITLNNKKYIPRGR